MFRIIRWLLVALTGRGYDRSAGLNDLHHKLAYRLHKLLPRFGITGVQRVPISSNRNMYVRAEDGGVAHQLIMYQQYEPFETSQVRACLKKGMNVYNIGANLGYYALVASECVGPTGNVFAFEPAQENLELLRKAIAESSATNVQIIPAAVSDSVGAATLSLSATNSGDHQLADIATRDHVSVDVTTVDAFVAEGQPLPDAIIMDVQGSELAVLNGAALTFQQHAPEVLFTEFWPEGLNAREPGGAQKFLEILEEHFALHVIDEKQRQLRPVSPEELLTKVTGHNEANLLCTRRAL